VQIIPGDKNKNSGHYLEGCEMWVTTRIKEKMLINGMKLRNFRAPFIIWQKKNIGKSRV
jgi:hypothetical protein